MTPTTGSRARLERDTIDAIVAAQHGIVSRTQLRDAGISLCAIDNALKAGRVRLVHRGVYRVGPLMVQCAREMAALLACGSAAAISHASAAALLQLARPRTRAELIEVTVPGSCGRKVAGLRIYRARLGDDEVVQLEGMRVTSAARTLLDLARILTHAELERALAVADRDRLLDTLIFSACCNATRAIAPLTSCVPF